MKPSSAARRRGPPLQRWLTFLRNHAPNIADMDLFVVPTFGLDLLDVLVIVRLGRTGSTSHRVELRSGSAHQITEAFRAT